MCAKQYTVALEFQSIKYKRYQVVMQIPPGDEATLALAPYPLTLALSPYPLTLALSLAP